jgi:hypothetical protein
LLRRRVGGEGRYSNLAPLGKGTFARVVAALDRRPAEGGTERVAIKVLRRSEHIAAAGRHELQTLQR